MLGIVCLLATGCGGGKKEQTLPPAEPAPVAKAEPEREAVGEAWLSGVPACDEYTEKFLRCLESDKYPAAAKEPARQAFEQMRQGWNFDGLEGDEREAVMDAAESACREAIDVMQEGGESVCPGVWGENTDQARASRLPPPPPPPSISDEEIRRLLAKGTGVLACDDYARRMFACMDSPNYPEAARAATRDAFVQMLQAWNFDGVSPEQRRAAETAAGDACKQAIEAMHQAADSICPGVF